MRAVAAAPAAASAARVVALGLLAPVLAGAACVFGFAPFYAWPIPILALAVLFFVWQRSGSPRQAALSGFAFGLGYFLAGVSWVFVSLHRFGSMPVVLAAVATFLFCAGLALFPAAAGWIVARFAASDSRRRLLLCVAATVALEWLRGWIFTGFAWLDLGTSQVPSSPLAGYAPYLGAYGTSLAVAAAAALAVALAASRAWSRSRIWIIGGAAALFIVGGLAKTVEWTQPAGAPITIALLQGNVAQDLKWREEVRAQTLADYRRMIIEAKARVVITPETALPAFLDQLPADYVESLREHARQAGKDILLGTVEREYHGRQFDYYNSVVTLTGGAMQSYRKRHLVPFGEYIPPGFQWVLAVLKIPMSDMARGAPSQPPLKAAGTAFGVAICYEDAFGEEVIDALPDAGILANVSNDAWFGESFAAEQHLQASQMRALETGRWIVRATNTGATAAIDDKGRVVSRLPAFTAATLVQAVTPRSGMTPYARAGNLPALILVALVAAIALRRRNVA
ncbi:MAG: apolipoprotein N-acyltransferase [Usitatibacter sp.]